jgi:lipoprotein-anchoring transpeptidase ErfK/SrfK
MTPTTEKIQSPLHKNNWAKRWMLIILLVIPLLVVWGGTPAYSSYAPNPGDLLANPGLTPPANSTATRTNKPTATKTPLPSLTPETKVKVSGGLVNLRTGPGINYLKVRQLTYGEPLVLLGSLKDNTWLYVKTLHGQFGWIKTTLVDLGRFSLKYDYLPTEILPPTETATPVVLAGIEGRWIDIDLSEQMLRAYDGTELVDSFLVSTGLDLYPTETGKYRIYVKMRYSDMRGNDFFLPDVPYSMYYSGDFSIHGTYWHHSFGTPMSHGCVNMDTRDAEWLYNWASVGTLVNIHR